MTGGLLNPAAEHKTCQDMIALAKEEEDRQMRSLAGPVPLDREAYLKAHSAMVAARTIREGLQELYGKRFNR